MSLTAEMLGDAVAGYLGREYGHLKSGDKIAARDLRVTPRTIRNWLTRQCSPRSIELLRLMASCDELRDDVLRLVDQAKAQD